MTALDALYAWMLDTLPWSLGSGGPVLAFPATAIAVLVTARILVRWVLPLVVRYAITVASGLTVVVGVLLLGADFLLASFFRLCRLRPPSLVYGLGDTLVAATRGAQAGFRFLLIRSGRLVDGLSDNVVLLLVFALFWWWSTGYCERLASAGCTDPVTSWLQLVMP